MESFWRNKITESAVVIGNGESRSSIDLGVFSDSTTIGCNALHRDFIPNHLICCDKRMVEESLNNPKTLETKIYTRKDWARHFRKIHKKKNVFAVPDLPYRGDQRCDQPVHWGSGNYAVLLAPMNFQNIVLIGFDLYDTQDKINNIYKDTVNYSPKNSKPVDPSYWIYQISRVMEIYSEKKFIIYNRSGWTAPRQWLKSNAIYENISNISLTNK